jgi:hypothetical protein
MKNHYAETFQGKALVRTEHPLNTWKWLARREELAGKAEARAATALGEARQAGVKPRDMADLTAALEQALAELVHARDTRAAFAKRWTPGEGYSDPEDCVDVPKLRPVPSAAAEPLPPMIDDEAAGEDIDDIADSLRRPARLPRRDGLPHPAEAPARRAAAPMATVAAQRPRPIAPQPAPAPSNEPLSASSSPVPDASVSPAPPTVPPSPAADGSATPSTGAPTQSALFGEPEQREPASAPEPFAVKSYKGLKNTPPDEYKFKKGEPSRNQKGRPKGAKNLKTVIKDVFEQPVPIRAENGRKRTITMAAGIFEMHARQALNGDVRSLAVIANLLAKYWNDDALPEKIVELTPEERSILKNRLLMMKLIDPDDRDGGDKP